MTPSAPPWPRSWPVNADYRKAYLTLQEFFEKLRDEPQRWGKPFSALSCGVWTPSWSWGRRHRR